MGLRAKRSLRQKSGSNWPVFSVSRMRRALLASVLFGTPLAALNWSVVRCGVKDGSLRKLTCPTV